MPYLSRRQATIISVLVLICTIVLHYFLPGYTITLIGLLIIIFLSVFIISQRSTIVWGIISGVVAILFLIRDVYLLHSKSPIPQFAFLILLIFFSTLIVLYIKRLIRDMQFGKSHMTSLFENATEGILLTNSKGKIILANPAACRIFAYNAAELIGKQVEALIPYQYRTAHVQLRNGFYQSPQNRQMGSGRDLFAQKKNGENFPVEVSLSPYKQRDELYVIAFIVDITHRKKIEKSILQQQLQLEKVTADIRKLNIELEAKVEERTLILQEALKRLEQSQQELSAALDKERQLNEIKSRFVSMASHEFRTPLSTVLSSVSLIAKYTTTEQQEKRDKHIHRIKDSVKHLNDLLEDFLSLGKLDEGKIEAVPETFNLPEVILETAEDMKGIVKNDQYIQCQHSGRELMINDKKLLKNILINLISNAVKFSQEGSCIHINSQITDHSAVITVQDEGIGIAEEDMHHLFTSFFRGKNALNIQGTGLGLHIVKRYVDLMRGKINLQSELGKGTTLTITLPLNHPLYAKVHSGNR